MKEILKTIVKKEKENIYIVQIKTFMRGNLKEGKFMEKENIHTNKVIYMKANIKMKKEMGKELIFIVTGINI